MKPLHKNKAVALYETRLRVGFIVSTVVCYIIAMLLWYAICAITPYMDSVSVSAENSARVSRAALSATADDIAADEREKERAILLPTSARSELLPNDSSSFLLRLNLIESAKRTVDYLVYDSYEESYTQYYYAALVRAADRGVKVRIILDGKMGRLSGSLSKLEKIIAAHENMELYYFNGVNLLKPAGLMVLMHDKVTIVDCETLIVGGVNMGTSAFLYNYDMEVLVGNSGALGSAGQATRYFEQMKNSGFCKRKTAKSYDRAAKAEYERRLCEFYGKSEFADKTIDYSAIGVAVDKCTFLTNEITGGKKEPIVLQALYNLAEGSEKSNWVTPYVLLTDKKIKQLRDIAQSNDGFRIVTNSLYNTRNVAYAKYYFAREDFISDSIELWELQTENQLHSKMYTFDGRYSVIGSFNLDERSVHIDTEAVLVIDSPAFTSTVDEYINYEFISNSLRVGGDNRYIIGEGGVIAGEVSAGKSAKYILYNLLSCVVNII